MALFLDIGLDDLLQVGEDLVISIERKSGSRARLRIEGTTRVELLKRARVAKPVPDGEDDGRSK